MLFNSFSFALFLPIVFLLYWALPHRFRWILLLVSSYYFYMSWNAKYVVLILFTTVISYATALLVEKARTRRLKKLYMLTAVIASLAVLFFFKYFNFFSSSVTEWLQKLSIPVQSVTLKIMLPVGISFYTFQTLSYVIDVYRGTTKAEHHFGIYATFVSFFPQLVAGPIERSENLLPQISSRKKFRYKDASYGIKLMAWGFFKKIVIADGLSIYVNQVYNDLPSYSGFALALTTFFFAFQIYCDFSGYSDIAIGSAKLMGIQLMTNFKSPYFAASIKEFWGRWHISLSTWFRDYVYIPLGGNRVGKLRHAFNLMATFLASGMWHGANWTYIFWGGIHGALQIVESMFPWNRKTSPFSKNRGLHGAVSIVTIPVTFFCVCLAWVFFRAQTIHEGFYVIQHMFTGISQFGTYIVTGAAQLGVTAQHMIWSCLPLALLLIYDFASLKVDVIAAVSKQRFFIRWPLYVLLLLIILLFSEKGVSTEFIYFQF